MRSKIPNYFKFILALGGYFGQPISSQQAKENISRRLLRQKDNFINLFDKGVYRNLGSPFRVLLEAAHISFSALKELAQAYGPQQALEVLKKRGIYLTLEEFKGTVPVYRFGKTFNFKEEDFDNPYLGAYMQTFSGGSRSSGTRTIFDLDYLTDWSLYDSVLFDIFDVRRMPLALWLPAMPAYAGIKSLLCYSKIGKNVRQWFFLNERKTVKDSYLPYDWFTRYVFLIKKIANAGVTDLRYVPLPNISAIVDWIKIQLKDCGACAIHTYVSYAVRICLFAKENGIDIKGVVFIVGSEPLTITKKKIIEDAGCIVAPRYIVTEIGPLAYSCGESNKSDRMHVLEDSVILIKDENGALLATNLLLTASKILVNVETGDFGDLDKSRCNCSWHNLGFHNVIENVASYKKIITDGVTFNAGEIMNCLEQLMFNSFKVSPHDFQLLEEEKDGVSRLLLYVSPRVNAADEQIVKMVIDEIAKINSKYKILTDIWRNSATLQIVRSQPLLTSRGKFFQYYKRSVN